MRFERSGLTALVCALLVSSFPAHSQSRRIPGVDPIPVDATPDQMRTAVSNARVGRSLAPKSWPGGARVAVCISFDVDNETLWRTRPLPVPLSEGEYGAKEALPRILAMLDREQIPASFYIPAMSAMLHPDMIPEILKRKRHEIGVHGWTHEEPSYIGDAAKEEQLLTQAIDYITRQIGHRPAGIRAPSWDFSPSTLELIRKAGFLYDSSMMGMDRPYEPLSAGRPTNLIELPINWIADDYPYYEPEAAGSLPSADAIFQIYKAEFDGAYAEHSLFILTTHPHITGHRSRIIALQRLIEYIKTKPDVWFATLEQVANHVKASAPPASASAASAAEAMPLAAAEPYPHAGEPIGTVRQMYDGTLPPDIAVNTFRNIGRLFPTRTIEHGTKVMPLPRSEKQLTNIKFASRGRNWDLVDYLAVNRVTGLLVLKDGQIAYEGYQYGNTDKTRWMSMSVAKSMTSTLIASAVKQGLIGSINDPVTKYVPKLTGSAYDGVSIRDILMMSSGVRWNETYTDPASDRRHLLEAQIAQRPGGALELMASLPRAAPPGTVNNYSTGETQIAGEILRGAIKKPLAQYLSERIWKKAGMESDATWWLDSPDGMEIAGSGLSATLRDYGRFGLFFLNGGIADGEQIVPTGWTQEAGAPKTLKGGKKLEYGYFWWPTTPTEANPNPDGTFSAIGIFGQYIYLNPREKVVVVGWGARSKPEGRAIIDDTDFCAAVVAALR